MKTKCLQALLLAVICTFLASCCPGRCFKGMDVDRDGVPCADNCPQVYNPEQADYDDDGIGDVCDNCPYISNRGQEDEDCDGIGNPCEDYEITSETDYPSTVRPGEPFWDKICITNNSDAAITTVKPDCYNITTRWRNLGDKKPVVTRCRYKAYGIPTDLVTLDSGEDFCVWCDLSQTVAPSLLTSGNSYKIDYWYSNWLQDRAYDFLNEECTIAPEPCYPHIWIGWMKSHPERIVRVVGTSVAQKAADISFDSARWVTEWAEIKGPPISAQISNIEDHDVRDVVPSTILLNGTVKIIPGSERVSGGVLTVEFNGSEAIRSLGTVVPGTVYPTVQGRFKKGDDVFSGQGRVEIISRKAEPESHASN